MLFAYVFGSSGTAMENSLSDLDVAVYFDAEAGLIELNHKLAIYAEISRAIKRKALRPPQTYAEAFDILSENRILEAEFAHSFARIAGFRKFLAHDYESVDGRQICNYLFSGLDEVEEYVSRIEQAMK